MKWLPARIEDFCVTGSGGTPSRNRKERYYGGNIPWVKSGELRTDVVTDTEEKITEEAIAESSAKIVEPGAVLVAMYGATVGQSAILGIRAATNQAVCHIVPRSGMALPKFVHYAIKNQMPVLLASRVGGAQPNISQTIIRALHVPLPTLSEQRRIVEILDQADALRQQRRAADEKAQRILPALFYHMFGDPATNPMGWPVNTLGDLVTGKPQYGANAKAVEWSPGKPRYVRITDITDDGWLKTEGVVSLEQSDWHPYELHPGDILFARSGSVGRTYMYRDTDGACAFAGYLIRFCPDPSKIHPWYLFAFTHSRHYLGWVEAKKRVVAQPNINAKEYAGIQIPCPPTEQQQAFASQAEAIFLRSLSGRQAGEHLDRLMRTMLCRAFTGELTAKWRDAHRAELEAEMEAQAKALAEQQPRSARRGRKRRRS